MECHSLFWRWQFCSKILPTVPLHFRLWSSALFQDQQYSSLSYRTHCKEWKLLDLHNCLAHQVWEGWLGEWKLALTCLGDSRSVNNHCFRTCANCALQLHDSVINSLSAKNKNKKRVFWAHFGNNCAALNSSDHLVRHQPCSDCHRPIRTDNVLISLRFVFGNPYKTWSPAGQFCFKSCQIRQCSPSAS